MFVESLYVIVLHLSADIFYVFVVLLCASSCLVSLLFCLCGCFVCLICFVLLRSCKVDPVSQLVTENVIFTNGIQVIVVCCVQPFILSPWPTDVNCGLTAELAMQCTY